MTVRALIEKAIGLAESEAKLGKAAGGFSQNAIWQAKRRGRVSPELALGIHKATQGRVSASELRPDLWASPKDVPSPQPSANAPTAPINPHTASEVAS
jgi:DNA-binding transcriptional regulator YdaS (Cro superfamily)